MVPQIQPLIEADDVEAVRRAVETTFVSEHDQTRLFEQLLRERTGAAHVVAYTNASCALFAVLRALGIGAGDEVIVPDMTFVATANAVILAGATPIFADVDPDSMMITPDTVRPRLTARTRAIMPVHLYGMAAEMPGLLALAAEHDLRVVEDAAQGIGVRLHRSHVGTFGDAGVLSFYGNKTLTTGEGGAILTNSAELAKKCYRLKNHGRTRKGVFIHDEIGFNFSFTEMQAALGVSQCRKLDRIIDGKRRIHDQYADRLKDVDGLRVQSAPHGTDPVYWFTNIFCDNAAAFERSLAQAGIQSRRFLYPMHLQPCYRTFQAPCCPTSAELYKTGLSLPSWVGLPHDVIDRVCDVLQSAQAPA